MLATAGSAAVPASGGALSEYVRARAAQSGGAPSAAAQGFARALAVEPANEMLAGQTLAQALAAGEWRLASHAASRLDAAGTLPLDGLLFILSNAVKRGDWRAADAAVERIEAGRGFTFLTPAIRAWMAFGARRGDPLSLLGDRQDAAGQAYQQEHRALLLLAMKRKAEGAGAIAAVSAGAGGRVIRLKLAGAARLARLGEREPAMALLAGPDEPLVAARNLVASGKAIPGAVDSAADGIAELFARFAVDLQRERVTPLALSFARLSTYLAPDNSETWLVTSELLSADGKIDAALIALDGVDASDPFAAAARAIRAQLLVRNGDVATALGEARLAAAAKVATPTDLVRYADLLAEAKRHADAAPLYAQAIARRERGAPGPDLWLLHLLRGSALEEAGRWPEAKAALEEAYRIAPQEPQVLNFLGYAQLERRENLDAAEALIREASRLQPDDASITDSLGWALFRRGKLAEAVATLERASATDPRQAAIGEHLGDAYWSAGRRVEARYAWSAAMLHADAEESARLRAKLESGLSAAVAAP